MSLSALPFKVDVTGEFPSVSSASAKNYKDDKDDKANKGGNGNKGGNANNGSEKADKGGDTGANKSAGSKPAPAAVLPSRPTSFSLSERLKRALDVIQDLFGGQVGGDLSDEDEAALIRRGWTLPPD